MTATSDPIVPTLAAFITGICATNKVEPPKIISAGTNIRHIEEMDSLDRAEFLMMVEDHFKVDISDAEFVAVQTLGEIAELVNARRRQAAP